MDAQMTLGGASVVIGQNVIHAPDACILINIWPGLDDEKAVDLAINMLEAKAFHAALGALISHCESEKDIYVEKQKADWRTEGKEY